jgi:hypothetical protein
MPARADWSCPHLLHHASPVTNYLMTELLCRITTGHLSTIVTTMSEQAGASTQARRQSTCALGEDGLRDASKVVAREAQLLLAQCVRARVASAHEHTWTYSCHVVALTLSCTCDSASEAACRGCKGGVRAGA